MKFKLLFLAVVLTASIGANAQKSASPTIEALTQTSFEKPESPKNKTTTPDDADKTIQPPNQSQQLTYVRPNGKSVFVVI